MIRKGQVQLENPCVDVATLAFTRDGKEGMLGGRWADSESLGRART